MRLLVASLLISFVCAPLAGAADDKVDVADLRWFEKQIRPVLITKCLKCHGEAKQEGNLRLDSMESILKGGDSGPAIVPGRPQESLLVEAIRYDGLEMPPTGKLSQGAIRNLEEWVARSAPWPEHGKLIREQVGKISPLDRQWWAFQPLQKPNVPAIEDDNWSRNEVDRFVYEKLASRGLHPAPPAEKEVLVRRLYFDLIGVPPSPQQVSEFLNDDATDAWSRLVDSLLADERYGERWARYWLDVVRYSDSDGWNQDAFRPHIWRYRDYVVDAFNDDKPYPEFVLEQLAGDEIPGDHPEILAATGFLRLGIYEYNQRDARSHWDDIMNEMTDVAGDVFLGMGMACARCHDHKFDPLLQQDYFRLRAFFEPIEWRDDKQLATRGQLETYAAQLEVWKKATREIQLAIDELLKPYHDRKWVSTADKFPLDIQACFNKPVAERTSWEHQMAYLVIRQFEEEGGGPLKDMKSADKERYEELQKKLTAFDDIKPVALPLLMAASDFSGAISPTVIPDDLSRTPVAPGFLTVLTGLVAGESTGEVTSQQDAPGGHLSSGRRTSLAKWIGRPDNPLTNRVFVNRIWQEHFGRGIVSTANDFGSLGQPPSHRELLDWLTVTFVESGWSIKELHKRILMSAAWRQSAHHPKASEFGVLDPGEQLIWRARVRRLKAEEIRDAMLFVSGELQTQVGGPSVDGDAFRRSLYIKSFRNTPDEFLHAFDVANGLKSVAERNSTTTPSQSLLMINGDYALRRAEKLAERLIADTSATGPEAIGPEVLTAAFRMVWSREPNESELLSSQQFVNAAADPDTNVSQRDRLVDFCHVLLNSNEFLYID